MQIEIHLLARLLRVPLLRIDGIVAIDEDARPSLKANVNGEVLRVVERSSHRRDGADDRAPLGRDLAAAEAIILRMDRKDRKEG